MVDLSGLGTKNKDSPIKPKIIELNKKEGNENDPIGIIFETLADQIDGLKAHAAGLGPDAGKLIAAEASRVIRQDMGRLSNRIRGLTLACVALGQAVLVAGGVWAGWTLRGSAPVQVAGADIPVAMAYLFPYQDWRRQWDARRTLPAGKDGATWVLVPMVEKLPIPK